MGKAKEHLAQNREVFFCSAGQIKYWTFLFKKIIIKHTQLEIQLNTIRAMTKKNSCLKPLEICQIPPSENDSGGGEKENQNSRVQLILVIVEFQNQPLNTAFTTASCLEALKERRPQKIQHLSLTKHHQNYIWHQVLWSDELKMKHCRHAHHYHVCQ